MLRVFPDCRNATQKRKCAARNDPFRNSGLGGTDRIVPRILAGLHFGVRWRPKGASRIRFSRPDRIVGRVAGSEGRAVVLGLRPETIFVAGAELPGPDRFVFERPVVADAPIGPDTRIVFEIGGQDFIARVRPQDAMPRGTLFRAEVEMDRTKLFDAKTGKRL